MNDSTIGMLIVFFGILITALVAGLRKSLASDSSKIQTLLIEIRDKLGK